MLCRENEFRVFSLTRAMLCGILKGKRLLPQKSSRSETMHRQLKRAAKMRYVYFLYISAMICILFAEKYTYPVKRWWKMTTNAQFEPNIPWDRAVGETSWSRCERCPGRRDLPVSMRSAVPVVRGPVPRRAKIVPFHRSAGACPPRSHSSGAGLARYEQDFQDFRD